MLSNPELAGLSAPVQKWLFRTFGAAYGAGPKDAEIAGA